MQLFLTFKVLLDGTSLQVMSGSLPCELLNTTRHLITTCDQVTINIPQTTTTSVNTPMIELELPGLSQCSVTNKGALTFVPPPNLYDIEPPAACYGQANHLELFGSYLFTLNGALPYVHILEKL